MTLKNDVRNAIIAAIPDSQVYVFDPDGQHLEAIVISPLFTTLSLVRQHQVVMNALKESFSTTLHALALKTFTPEKWEKEKNNYQLPK